MTVRYSGRELTVNGACVVTEEPIADAFEIGDIVIVLIDAPAVIKHGQFQNLLAFDRLGRRLWTADLPTTNTGDTYYAIGSRDPLVALSTQSFDCEIDTTTGHIMRKTFTK